MNFKQLDQFIKVAKIRSFTKAAEALYISQPALSRTISNLERELGFPLFVRSPQGLTLTEAGSAFLAGLSDASDLFNQTIRQAQLISATRLTDLSVTVCFEDFSDELLFRLQDAVDTLRIHFSRMPPGQAYRELLAGKIDFAIVPGMQPHTDIRSELLLTEQMLVVSYPGHPLYGLRVAPAQALQGQHFVCNELSFHQEAIERICTQYGLRLDIDFISTDRRQTEAYGRRYHRLAFLPVSELLTGGSAASAPEEKVVLPTAIEPQIFTRSINLAWGKGRVFNRTDRTLLLLLRSYYDERARDVKRAAAMTE